MKRKTIIALLALTLCLAGCGSTAPEPIEPSVTSAPEIKEDISISTSSVEAEDVPEVIESKVEPITAPEKDYTQVDLELSEMDKLGISATSVRGDYEDTNTDSAEEDKADTTEKADTTVKDEVQNETSVPSEDKKAETTKETFDVITKLRFDTPEEALAFLETHELDPKSYEIYGDDIKKMTDAVQKGGVYPWTFYGSNDYNFNLYEEMWCVDRSEAKYFKDADEVWRGAGVLFDGTVYFVEAAYYDGELADEIYYYK